jgi:hypothetical protein
MSYFKGVGNGSNSYGQFWFGGSNFPGFLYKKNTGVGGRKNPKYGLICNKPTTLWNSYTPGSGVGATSVSTRRSKMIKSTMCSTGSGCTKVHLNLGVHNNNSLGYYQYPRIPRYEVYGTYTYLPAEAGFNTVIRFTGISTIIINYSPLTITQLQYVDDLLVEPIVETVGPGSVDIVAGTVGLYTIVIVVKFNV